MKCPECGSENATKVISTGLPMKFCPDCALLWGEPWATIFDFFVAPLEGMLNGGFSFFTYEGSYLSGLWAWLNYSEGDDA